MIAQTKKLTLPAEYATALINHDYSGLAFYDPSGALDCQRTHDRYALKGWQFVDVSDSDVHGDAEYTMLRQRAAIRFSQTERDLMATWHSGQSSVMYAAQSVGYIPVYQGAYVKGQPSIDARMTYLGVRQLERELESCWQYASEAKDERQAARLASLIGKVSRVCDTWSAKLD